MRFPPGTNRFGVLNDAGHELTTSNHKVSQVFRSVTALENCQLRMELVGSNKAVKSLIKWLTLVCHQKVQ